MNDIFVNDFNNETFNHDGNESAILKSKYYNPPSLKFQQLTVKEKVKNVEVNRTGNGYIIDTLTSVDICEVFKKVGKVIEIYEGVIYRERFKISPFMKNLDKLFPLRQKYKVEGKDLMQGLVKFLMFLISALYGKQIRKDLNEFYTCKPQHWMETEYDDIVLDFWKLPNGNYITKIKER